MIRRPRGDDNYSSLLMTLKVLFTWAILCGRDTQYSHEIFSNLKKVTQASKVT